MYIYVRTYVHTYLRVLFIFSCFQCEYVLNAHVRTYVHIHTYVVKFTHHTPTVCASYALNLPLLCFQFAPYSTCVCVHIHVCTYTCVCIYVRVYVRTYAHIRTSHSYRCCAHTYIVHSYICMYVFIHFSSYLPLCRRHRSQNV